jgi:hypothetical protein
VGDPERLRVRNGDTDHLPIECGPFHALTKKKQIERGISFGFVAVVVPAIFFSAHRAYFIKSKVDNYKQTR